MNNALLDNQNVLAAEVRIPRGLPVTMMNLLAFHAEAQYEGSTEKPCSGTEAYLKRYVPAFTAVVGEFWVAIEVLYVGSVAYTVFGPQEPTWDFIALVRYPDFASIRKVIESPF